MAGPYAVTFDKGVTLPNQTCTIITTFNDTDVEGDQAFRVSISSVSIPSGIQFLSPTAVTAVLSDNDG